MENNQRVHFDIEKLRKNVGNNEALIIQLKSIALTSLNGYMQTFRELLETKDYLQAKVSAHKLKGSASGLCMGVLTDLAKKLEANETSDEAAIIDSISEIENEICYVLSILKSG